MSEFEIRTIAGGGVSVAVGASVVTFEVRPRGTEGRAIYTLWGVDFGFGAKGGAQGPSSWTQFSARCGLDGFHGYVTVLAAAAAAGVGIGGMTLDFVTGPAAGTRVTGIGWNTGLALGAAATHGWMRRSA